jgi:hypothetical protein
MAKAKTKPKTEKKADPAPAPKKTSAAPDMSWLGEKVEKRTAYFLERLSEKRQVDADRVMVACLAYCAALSQKRHGLHLIAQEIERVAGCKI